MTQRHAKPSPCPQLRACARAAGPARAARIALLAAAALGLAGCELWPRDAPYDPFRCDPPCSGGKICQDGVCRKLEERRDQGAADGRPLDRGRRDLPPVSDSAAPLADLHLPTPDQRVVPDAKPPPGPWAVSGGGATEDQAQSLAVDSAGNSYVVGSFSGAAALGSLSLTSAGGQDVFVAKLDTDGKFVWAISAGGAQSDQGVALVLDNLGSLLITGTYQDSATFGTHTLTGSSQDNLFVARLDSSGKFRWVTSASSSTSVSPNDLQADGAGNAYVAGSYSGTLPLGSTSLEAKTSEAFVAQLAGAGGAWQWARSSESGSVTSSSHKQFGNGLFVEAGGDAYLTGAFSGSMRLDSQRLYAHGDLDAFVGKLASNGKWTWATSLGGTQSDLGRRVVVDSGGSCYVAGIFSGVASFGSQTLTAVGQSDVFTVKLNGGGKVSWALAAGGLQGDRVTGLALNSTQKVYLTGQFQGSATFGSLSLSASAGSAASFVSKVDPAGAYIWANPLAGVTLDLDLDSDQLLYLCGSLSGSAAFGTTQLSSLGGNDVWVARTTSLGTF